MGKKQIKISLFQVITLFVIFLIILAVAGLYVVKIIKERETETGGVVNPTIGKVDDWKYSAKEYESDYGGIYKGLGGAVINSTQSFDSAAVTTMEQSSSYIGLSTGGAKDVNNFRKNIENGYFPILTDITYNGLFYDYTFDTGNKGESKELFSPSYSCAVSNDPISNEKEYYMTVGLNSNIKESDFQRKKLNLVVVLDISGSMSSGFSSYYYDNPYKENDGENKTKMQIANESVNILIDRLNNDDRFGMVLFDDAGYLAKPMNLVSETDIEAIKGHVLEIQARGGTNFEAGYTKATELFKEYKGNNADEYENRIIVITDAMPNYGTTSKSGLLSYVKENATQGIYTTFIGVGVDFNTELIEEISDVKGANYYSVHSASEFKERMGEQFEYMVTPLVFDLNLDLESKDYEISMVYGTDTKNKENGNIMKVNTLFPSKTTSNGEVKGGVILLKLKKISNNDLGKVELKVSYKDRNGKPYSNSQSVEFKEGQEYYDNTGIRKAITLVRYANTIKNWILYERTENERFYIRPAIGITDCYPTKEEVIRLLGENERTSVKLTVSEEYKDVFKKIKSYMEKEIEALKDEDMEQEIKLLEKLIKTE